MADAAGVARAELVACLARIAAGDHAALAYLYERTSAKLFGICVRILVDEAAAEDVLQDVFLTVWRQARVFDPARGVSPITWLAAITRNRALDRLRARAPAAGGLEEAAEVPDQLPLPEEAAEAAQRHARLHDCLAALDERAAGAIRAAFFGGMTYQALAAQAGMPLATMKSLVRRALAQLKACLAA